MNLKRILSILVLTYTSLFLSAQPAQIGGYHVYYGSLHNHSSISDGEGSAVDAYTQAKTSAGYDFFALTDHGELMSQTEWNTTRNVANAYNEDGVFTALWGFEWSSPVYGHAVIIGSNSFCDAIFGSTNNFSKLTDWINSHECLAFFAHPGYTDENNAEFNHFNGSPSEKFIGMELWNGTEGFNYYYSNNGYFLDDGGFSYYDEALHRGWKIGATGNEDNHNADWGVLDSKMAVLAGELTRNGILDAIKSRRFYATLDKNMEVSFKIQGQEMGGTLYPGSYTGEIRLHDANEELFTSVDLIRNGIIDQTFQVLSAAPMISFTCHAGNSDYFYIRVYQEDGDQAISSPIFFADSPGATALSEFSENGLSIRVSSSDAGNLISVDGAVKPETIAVADLTGHIVTMLQIHPGEVVKVSSETFPCGMYLVFMADHREVKVQKLVVQ